MFEGAALDLEEELDRANEEVARAQRHLLAVIRRASDAGIWRRSGARNLAHWLSMRYGVASWKANRWIAAARALEVLPAITRPSPPAG